MNNNLIEETRGKWFEAGEEFRKWCGEVKKKEWMKRKVQAIAFILGCCIICLFVPAYLTKCIVVSGQDWLFLFWPLPLFWGGIVYNKIIR